MGQTQTRGSQAIISFKVSYFFWRYGKWSDARPSLPEPPEPAPEPVSQMAACHRGTLGRCPVLEPPAALRIQRKAAESCGPRRILALLLQKQLTRGFALLSWKKEFLNFLWLKNLKWDNLHQFPQIGLLSMFLEKWTVFCVWEQIPWEPSGNKF